MTALERQARAQEADALCVRAWTESGGGDEGCALVAVGGYGRGELAPYSDLDVVLVHDEGLDPGRLAGDLWYPLWDSGWPIDHAVRSWAQMTERAEQDVRVALGLLDVRHLAGDPHLTLRLRTDVLAHWRRTARTSLPALRELTDARHQRFGELAHASIPDLKESMGGLRDTTVLRALTATWLVDVPADLSRARDQVLDLRDALRSINRRSNDRITPEAWATLAEATGCDGPQEAQRRVRALGRHVGHLSRTSWRRVDGALSRPARTHSQRGRRGESIGHGLAILDAEVVLDRGARSGEPLVVLLRAAAEAAERGLVLSPYAAALLVRDAPDLPVPWPREARDLLVRLLLAGPGLLQVWETLDETGALERLLPEWERIRLLPHATQLHRFTVDRHVVETCIEASALIRHVGRPDVLAVSALLHDIGKGGLTEHSVAGAPIAREVAERLGFDPAAVDTIGTLVRWHLLLAQVATTRDPGDPATAAHVAERIADPETLDLLLALTQADARAASSQAWTSWRAGLVRQLVGHVHGLLQGRVGDPGVPATPRRLAVPAGDDVALTVEPVEDGSRVTFVACDRVGLLADVTATLALGRIPVRAARVWDQDEYGVSVWDVPEIHLDRAVLRQRYLALRAGRLDVATRLTGVAGGLDPTVAVRGDASRRATVLEVRAGNHAGVLHRVCAALAECGVDVRSAHVDTLGPQAVDVFYVTEAGAAALSEPRAAEVAHRVRAALTASLDTPATSRA